MSDDRSTELNGTDERRGNRTVSRRAVVRSLGVTGAAGLSGCSGRLENQPAASTSTATATTESAPLSGKINVAGSSTVYPVTLDVGERFATEHPNVTVSVTSTGTGGGFENYFCAGLTEINDASREISEAERSRCRGNGVDPVEFKVATDALTVVVNPRADWVSCVTIDELSLIWRADGAERWSDVRPEWPSEPIELYGPTPASGTFDYFSETVLGEGFDHRTDYRGTEQDSTIVESVMDSRYAIGYFGFAYYNRNADSIKAVSIDDGTGCVAPTFESAMRGRYEPLSRPLYIYVDREALETRLVNRFVRFYVRLATTSRIQEIGYVPLDSETAEANLQVVEDHAQ